MKKKVGLWLTVACLLIACIAAPLCYYFYEDRLEVVRDEALVQLEADRGLYDEQSIVLPNTSKAQAEKLAELYDADLRITKDGRFAALTLPEGMTIRDAYAMEESLPYIEDMYADYRMSISEVNQEASNYTPTAVRPQHQPSDKDYKRQTYLDYLNLQSVWDSYTGDGVTVAVIDSGIDTDHPEFAGRISEYSYNASQDKIVKDYTDENGDYDWSLIEDEQGHGTAVTGVIAATMNSDNVTGIAPNVEIIVIKVEGDGVTINTSDAAFGLYYAIERDADVVNMSFGGNHSDPIMSTAVELAYDSDVICVAGAGNNANAALVWPAAHQHVIGVGALGANSWTLADYSCYGENVDVVAPGTVYTTKINGDYGTISGTSFASPVTSAIVALYMQKNPYATFDEVYEALTISATDLGDAGRDWYYGFGAVDADTLLNGQRGTITYDMLTDELEDEEGRFVVGRPLQELPEPDRLYAVFDGWYYDDTFTQKVEYYEDAFYGDLTLYAKWANEEDGVPYTYVVLEDGTVEIRSYTGSRHFITVPDRIEGRVVSSIGDRAFEGQTRLREVTLPSQLTHIGDMAFLNCSNLVKIEIPATVTTIGKMAFADAVRMTTVSIPEKGQLTDIGDFAFSGCSALEEIWLPVSLQRVNGTAFEGATALRRIEAPKANKQFTSYDGVLYNFTGGTLVAYPAAHGEEYVLLNNTHTIGTYAFAKAKVKTLDLSKVKYLEDYAFVGAELIAVEIPHQIKGVGEGVFTGNEHLKTVDFGDKLTTISKKMFSNCTSLEEVVIPARITAIEAEAFSMSGLRAVNFAKSNSLVTIGNNAFYGTLLTSVAIPDGVTQIGKNAFTCASLKVVTFGKDSRLKTIQSGAFSDNQNLSQIALPARLEHIADLAFSSTALESVTIPASVKEMGNGIFAYTYRLQEILVDKGNTKYHSVNGVLYTADDLKLVQYPIAKEDTNYTVNSATRVVGAYAFAGSQYLQSITLPEGLEVLAEKSFYNSGIQSINLPSTLTEIQVEAFKDSYKLSYLDIPDNVVQIGRHAVANCWNLSRITFSDNAKISRISYGAFAHSGITSFTVPASVNTMAQGAFEGCHRLTSVTFADHSRLESLSAYQFNDCINLADIHFGSDSALATIQAHGLEGMRNLTTLDLSGTKITEIDNFAFRFCDGLKQVVLPSTLKNIGRYAFYGCESLSQLSVPENLEHMGSYAFLATNDMEVYFASEMLPLYLDENWDYGLKGYYTGVTSVQQQGDYKYAKLTSGNVAVLDYLGDDTMVDLTAVDLGGAITIIGGAAFEDSTVTSIVLPDSLTAIQAGAFRYAPLTAVHIPANVTFIGREAFAYTDLQTLTFADNGHLSVVEQYAFEHTEALKSVTLPASLTTWGTGVFRAAGLESVSFAEGITITEIPDSAFTETKLKAIQLPDSVVQVGENAFRNVQTLASVTFGDNEGLRLLSNAFYHTGLTSLNIPANVTYIGEFCFVALTDLTEYTVAEENPYYTAVDGLLTTKNGRKLIAVPAGRTGALTVPAQVEEIGFGAFEESRLSTVLFHEDANILTLGYRAFFKAGNLTEITIPASVVSVDYYAFAYCENLQKVTFAEDNQLKGVYEGAFMGCISLEDILLPDSIVEIAESAFYGCAALDEIPVSDTGEIKGIYDYAFAYTGINGELTVPETVIDIGDYAFMGTKLTKVTVSDAKQKELHIGIGAFEKCDQITAVTLPFIGQSFDNEDVSWFGYIFGAGEYKANEIYVPASLKEVTITNGIHGLYAGAFYNCTGLETIDLPHSITLVEQDAFGDATARYTLTNTISAPADGFDKRILPEGSFGSGYYGELALADDTDEIADNVFMDCHDLTAVYLGEKITSIGYSAFEGCTSLKKLEMGDQLTVIKARAFMGCENLSDFSMPNGVQTIGHNAFNGSGITEMVIPNGVTSIDANTFQNCHNLTTVVIPESVTSVGYSAFEGCHNLISVTIPAKVTTINERTFTECDNLQSVTINGNVTAIHQRAFAGCGRLTDVVLPDSLTSIGESAFSDCSSLKTLSIPQKTTTIDGYAFYNCKSLESAALPEGLQAINTQLFSGCTNLATVTIPDSVTAVGERAFEDCAGLTALKLPSGITTIDSYAFSGCHSLTTLSIPQGVTEIKDGLCQNCTSLASVEIPENVTSIGAYAFTDCPITEITIPKNVTAIEFFAFRSCKFLTTVYNYSDLSLSFGSDNHGCVAQNAYFLIDAAGNLQKKEGDGGNAYIYTDDGFVFETRGDDYCLIAYLGNEEEITLPADINGSAYTINSFDGGVHVTLPKGITAISDYAFAENATMKSIHIPDSVVSIGTRAFFDCGALEEVVLPDGVQTIREYAFNYCTSLTNVVIPDSVTHIGEGAFDSCEQLATLSVPDSVVSIGNSAFHGSTKVSFTGDNPSFRWIDGILYDYEATSLLFVPDTVSGHIVLPEGITAINRQAFYNCKNLTGIEIPQSVTYIGDDAFYGCSNLTTVVLPKNLTTIGSGAFAACSSLTNISLPQSVTTLGGGAFSGCSSLTSVAIPSSLTSVPYNTFNGCTNLVSVALPEGLESISNDAFMNCSSLANVTLPNSLMYIGNNAFYRCSGLTDLVIPNKVVSIGYGAFSACSNLTSAVIPESVTMIQRDTFSDCTELTKLTLPHTLTSIDSYAFYNCKKLEPVTLPNSMTNISTTAFSNEIVLTVTKDHPIYKEVDSVLYDMVNGTVVYVPSNLAGDITIPEGVTVINSYTFNNRAITSVTIPHTVTDIESGAFSSCYSLESVIIPNSVKTIGESAFASCWNLERVSIGDGVTTIGGYAFRGCSKLRDVEMGDNVTSIGNWAFAQCSALFKVELPDGLTALGDYAFSNTPLTTVNIPAGLKTIPTFAFNYNELTSITIPKGVTAIHSNALSGDNLKVIYNYSDLDLTFGSSDNGSVAYNALFIVDEAGNITCRSNKYGYTKDGFLYENNNGVYTLHGYVGDEQRIVLPDTINGNTYKLNRFVGGQEILVPDAVTAIPADAFRSNSTATAIVLSDRVTEIGARAFRGCGNLADLVIPNRVGSIDREAFYGCVSLTELSIPDSVGWINTNAFKHSNIHTDYIDGVTSVDGWIVKVDEDVEFINHIEQYKGALVGAYENCHRLETAIWNGDALPSNVVTLYVAHISNRTRSVPNDSTTLKNVVMGASVGSDLRYNSNLLRYLTDVTIFVDAAEQDLRWDHNFFGWSNNNLVIYGNAWSWVNFYDKDDHIIQSAPYRNSQVIRLPIYNIEANEKYDYQLIGWDVNGDNKADSIPATTATDIHAYAVVDATARICTVRFEDASTGTVYETMQLPYGTAIRLPAAPTKKGHTFIAWNANEGDVITDDMVIYARWAHDGGGHTYAAPVWYEATCAMGGHYRHVCTVCSEYYVTGLTEPLSHHYEKHDVAPTCTKQGYTEYRCDGCGASTRVAVVNAPGHTYGEWIVESVATCVEEGTRYHVCDVCGTRETESIPSGGHAFAETARIDATCLQTGEITYGCTVCEETYSETLSLSGHSYERVLTTESFLNQLMQLSENVLWGYEGEQLCYFACTECGHVQTPAESTATRLSVLSSACRHAQSTHWEDRTQSTCNTKGVRVLICDDCQELLSIQSFSGDAGHSYDHDYDVDCNVCGEIRQSEQPIPIVYGGSSVSEDVRGLAFRFDMAVTGMTVAKDGYTAIYDAAMLGEYKVVKMGAIASNGFTTSDVEAKKLYAFDEDTASFAVRIINIPEKHFTSPITMKPYIVIEIDGVQHTIYGTEQTRTYAELAFE